MISPDSTLGIVSEESKHTVILPLLLVAFLKTQSSDAMQGKHDERICKWSKTFRRKTDFASKTHLWQHTDPKLKETTTYSSNCMSYFLLVSYVGFILFTLHSIRLQFLLLIREHKDDWDYFTRCRAVTMENRSLEESLPTREAEKRNWKG